MELHPVTGSQMNNEIDKDLFANDTVNCDRLPLKFTWTILLGFNNVNSE